MSTTHCRGYVSSSLRAAGHVAYPGFPMKFSNVLIIRQILVSIISISFFFQVRLTPDSLILSPTRTDDDHTLPGLCCICPAGCGRCCLPRGPDEVLKCSDIVACRPAQQDDAAQYMKKRFKDILSFNH